MDTFDIPVNELNLWQLKAEHHHIPEIVKAAASGCKLSPYHDKLAWVYARQSAVTAMLRKLGHDTDYALSNSFLDEYNVSRKLYKWIRNKPIGEIPIDKRKPKRYKPKPTGQHTSSVFKLLTTQNTGN